MDYADSMKSDRNTCPFFNAKHILWFLQDPNLGPFRLLHHVCFKDEGNTLCMLPVMLLSFHKCISKPDSCHVCRNTNCHSELDMCQIVGHLSNQLCHPHPPLFFNESERSFLLV